MHGANMKKVLILNSSGSEKEPVLVSLMHGENMKKVLILNSSGSEKDTVLESE